MCQEGYASSLAAASLIRPGPAGATDLDGGFAAWKAAGLPTSARRPEPAGGPLIGRAQCQAAGLRPAPA